MAKRRTKPTKKASESDKTEEIKLEIDGEKIGEVVEQLTKEPETYHNITEASILLKVNEQAVKLWIDHGHLELVNINGVMRISGGSLDRWRIKYRGMR